MNFGKKKDLLLLLGGLLVLGFLLFKNGSQKNKDMMSMSPTIHQANSGVPGPSNPLGQNEKYSDVKGMKTNTYGAHASKLDDPSMLLPNDSNSQWASVNPQGGGMLKGVNLLQAGSLIGINTVGSTMRNANLQVRSEPPNPQGNVGPWLNSTIEPDVHRQPLEIGGQR